MSYEVLLAGHIVAAVLWVGGAVAMILLALRITGAHASAQMADFAANIEWLGKFYFTPLDGRAKAMGDTLTTPGSQVPEEMAMKELNAGILGVRMVVDFAEIEARGRGVLGMRPPTARVKSKANVALLPVDTQLWVLTPQAKSTYSDLGHRQRYALTSPIVMPDSILSADDTTTRGSKLSDGVASAIGVLGGFGGQKTRTYQVTVDPVAWSKDVSAAMDEVGKVMIARFNADR